MRNIFNKLFIVFLLSLDVIIVEGKVILPSIIDNNMILQQKSKVLLWGKSEPNEKIIIYCSWNNDMVMACSNQNGEWSTKVLTPKAGGPYEISFIDKDTVKINNILIGDVWLCSGQSNMEMPMKGFNSQPIVNSIDIIANSNSKIPIRMFSVKKEASKKMIEDVKGKWCMNTPKAVSEFSAVGYSFGKQLYNTLGIPIGLINTSWGGANIESWMPEEILKLYPNINFDHLKNDDIVKVPQHAASMLYNSMLYPLRKISISGVIWYQGEANCLRNEQYEKLFPEFVKELRLLFNNESMPFYYVQIAPFSYFYNKEQLCGVLMRESQQKCESIIPNSKMVVITDLGEEFCIHPSEKIKVGNRLAYIALADKYNIEGINAESPKYKNKIIKDNKIILTFEHADNGLTSFNKELNNFEICGKDKVFYKAKAKIKNNTVVVWSEKISDPHGVRYAFKNFVIGDLFGTNGLPVSSFRTDF